MGETIGNKKWEVESEVRSGDRLRLKCSHCNRTKDESLFFRDATTKTGYKRECKNCTMSSRLKTKTITQQRQERAEYMRGYRSGKRKRES